MGTRLILKYIKLFFYIIVLVIILKTLKSSTEFKVNLNLKSIIPISLKNKVNVKNEVSIKRCVKFKNESIKFNNYFNNSILDNEEWEPLNQFIYTRFKAYYYRAESIVRLLAISRSNFNFEISCFLEFEDEPNNFLCLDTKYSVLRKYSKYGAFGIDCILPKDLKLNKARTEKLYLYNYEHKVRTRRAYEVSITNKINVPKPNSILLCSKQYNFTNDEFKNIKYWIDYSLSLGYNKIILFNNSIPYQNFFKLFKSYGDRLEMRNYKYLPYLFLEKRYPTPYFYNLKYISMELRRTHERIAINECYCDNRLEYERIAVLDDDEVIIPRPIFSDNNNLLPKQYKDNTINITSYLNNINKATDYSFEKSYWFTYAKMMSFNFMNDFMYSLEQALNSSNTYPITFRVENKLSNDRIEHVTFKIRHADDCRHSRHLLNNYNNLVRSDKKSYLKQTSLTKFERILCIILSYGFKEDGKSIHFTKEVISIGHHETIGFPIKKVISSMGYVSHFRNDFTYFSKTVIKIKSVILDLHLYKFLSNKSFVKNYEN